MNGMRYVQFIKKKFVVFFSFIFRNLKQATEETEEEEKNWRVEM